MEDIYDFFEALNEILELQKSLGYNNAPKRISKVEEVKPIEAEAPAGMADINYSANSIKSQKDPIYIAKNIKDKKARRKALKEVRRGNLNTKDDLK